MNPFFVLRTLRFDEIIDEHLDFMGFFCPTFLVEGNPDELENADELPEAGQSADDHPEAGAHPDEQRDGGGGRTATDWVKHFFGFRK